MTEVRTAAEMVDEEKFKEQFEDFKQRYAGSEGDIVHGLLILKLIVAITEKALGIDLKDIQIDIGGEDDASAA